MSAPINTLVAVDAGVDPLEVEKTLPLDSDINVVAFVDVLEEGWQNLLEERSDLVVVASVGSSERALDVIRTAVQQRPERPVVAFSHGSSPNGFLRRLFEAGADDVVVLPGDPQHVYFALQKALVRRQRQLAVTQAALSPLVCILGPKGGTGKTLVTANLGTALALEGKRVVLVDLDLQFGDLGLALGLAPERTIYDLAKSGGGLDHEKLNDYLTTHPSGIRVLLAPTRPDQASVITVDLLREVYALLRTMSDIVIVDTPPGFTAEVIASIDASTQVCMVGMLDSLSLKNTKLGLETLDLMGYPSDRISLVLNRADTKVGITREDVAVIAGRQPDVMVPSDREIPRSVNEGQPIVLANERAEASRAFRQLASLYMPKRAEDVDGVAATAGRGLFAMRRKG
jgi:MinD-like ATPase involved in chromosome partitioning or flagellar assembly/CheY-like chemotaxis protein